MGGFVDQPTKEHKTPVGGARPIMHLAAGQHVCIAVALSIDKQWASSQH
jgi:hypothetical protein